VGIFTIPSTSKDKDRANWALAYTALVELNHFSNMKGGNVFRTRFGNDGQYELPSEVLQKRPFDFLFLEQDGMRGVPSDEYVLAEIIGKYIFQNILRDSDVIINSKTEGFREILDGYDELGCPRCHLSFGISSLSFPRNVVREACAYRLAGDILSDILGELRNSVSKEPTYAINKLDSIFVELKRSFLGNEKDILKNVSRENGVVLFDMGRKREIITGISDKENFKYETFSGGDVERFFRPVRNDEKKIKRTIRDIIEDISHQNKRLTNINYNNLRIVILRRCREAFDGASIDHVKIIRRFFSDKYSDAWRESIIRELFSKSEPLLPLNWKCSIGEKYQPERLVLINAPFGPSLGSVSPNQGKFLKMLKSHRDHVGVLKFVSNPAKPYRVIFMREYVGFPLRIINGIDKYKEEYIIKRNKVKGDPIHTVRDGLYSWNELPAPDLNTIKRAFVTFVRGILIGVVRGLPQKEAGSHEIIYEYKSGYKRKLCRLYPIPILPPELAENILQQENLEIIGGTFKPDFFPPELLDILIKTINSSFQGGEIIDHLKSIERQISDSRKSMTEEEFRARLLETVKEIEDRNVIVSTHCKYIAEEWAREEGLNLGLVSPPESALEIVSIEESPNDYIEEKVNMPIGEIIKGELDEELKKTVDLKTDIKFMRQIKYLVKDARMRGIDLDALTGLMVDEWHTGDNFPEGEG